MAQSKTLKTTIVVGAVNKTQATFNRVAASVDKIDRKMARMQKRMSAASMGAMMNGGLAVATITAPIIAATKGIVDTMRKLENAKADLAATLAVEMGDLGAFTKQAESLASKTIFSAGEIIGAQREAAMAGFSQGEVLQATPDILNLATMASIEIPVAATLATDVLRGYGLEVDELSRINDVFAYSSTKANQDTQQFMRGMVRFGPIARLMNMDISRSTAYLSQLADAGFKSAEGGNALRTIMLRMSAPTAAARKAIAELGIDLASFSSSRASAGGLINSLVQSGIAGAEQLEALKPRLARALEVEPPEGMTREQVINDFLIGELGMTGADGAQLAGAVGDYLSNSLSGLDVSGLLAEIDNQATARGIDPVALSNSIFGKMRAAQGGVLLKGAADIERRALDIAEKSGGAAARMAATKMESIDSILKLVTSAKELLQQKVWDAGFGVEFTKITRAFTNTLLVLSELPPAILNTTMKFAGLAAVIGPVILGVGLLVNIASFALAPFVSLGLAIAALTIRMVAFTASMATMRGIRLLLSPVGALAIAIGGVGAAFMYAVKDSASLTMAMSRARSGFKYLYEAIATGDLGKARSGIVLLKRAIEVATPAIAEISKAWLQNTVGPQRYAATLASLKSIIESVSNTFGNITAAVGGFFTGLAEGLGFTSSLGDSVGSLAKMLQSLAAWLVSTAAYLFDVDDSASSLRKTMADIGKVVGGAVLGAFDALSGVLKKLGDALNAVFSSAAWGAIERFFGFTAGSTVSAINDTSSAFWKLAKAMGAVLLASTAIFGIGRTMRGVGALAAGGMALARGGIAATRGATLATIGGARGARAVKAVKAPKANPKGWARVGQVLVNALLLPFKGIGKLIKFFLSPIAKVGKAIMSPFKAIAKGFGGIMKFLTAGMGASFRAFGGNIVRGLGVALRFGLRFIAGPIGWALLGAEIIYQVYSWWPQIKAAIAGIGEKMPAAWEWIKSAASDLGDKFSSMISSAGRSLKMGYHLYVAPVIRGIGAWLKEAFNSRVEAALKISAAVWDSVTTTFSDLSSAAYDGITSKFDAVGDWFALQIANIIIKATEIKDAVVAKFSEIGDAIAGAIKAPFEAIATWFADRIGELIALVPTGLAESMGLSQPPALASDPTPNLPTTMVPTAGPVVVPQVGAPALPTVTPRAGAIVGPQFMPMPGAAIIPRPGADIDGGVGELQRYLTEPSASLGASQSGISPTPANKTFKEQGLANSGVSGEIRAMRSEMAGVRELLANGAVKAEIDGKATVDVNIRAAAGLAAATVSASTGGVKANLNTGRDALAS
jgi:Phage-related minor tail protein